MKLSRRPATADDIPFLLQLRRLSMDPHLSTAGVRTDDADRLARLLYRFDCAELLLAPGDLPIGLLKVARDGAVWQVIQIQLLPEHQGGGMGAWLLAELLDAAAAAGASVSLSVLKANPARRLYERLGFRGDGESDDEFHLCFGPDALARSTAALFPGFTARRVEVADGITIAAVVGGAGPPLLLLHGHPQTHAIWHRVAPALAARFTVVAADLRGYGDSAKPPAAADQADHANYAKRAMALDQLALMRQLGFERFDVLAHDRGARVAHRLAADHPQAVRRLVLLDIAPTLAMYEQTAEAFARAYWHWFFLIQPAPLPERLIEADPAAYLRDVMGRRSAGLAPFDPRALAEYARCLALPGAAHGLCEDYRAAAGIDLAHDRADRDAGRKLQQPLLALWGADGVVQRCFRPLDEWRRVAQQVDGGTLPCGHYIAEEAPDALLARVLPFLLDEAA